MQVDIKNFSKDELTQFVAEIGQPKYRADQLSDWIVYRLTYSSAALSKKEEDTFS